jgi:hypothetical protein
VAITRNRADFLSQTLAACDPQRLHGPHTLIGSAEHLDLFRKSIAEKLVVRALREGSSQWRRLASAPVPDDERWFVFTAALDMNVPGLRSVPAHTKWRP